jgi:hypothetical protein
MMKTGAISGDCIIANKFTLFNNDEMNYIYRLVFSYLGDPKKIPIPSVTYRPAKAFFHFDRILNEEDRSRIIKIAGTLNNAIGKPVQVQDEYLVDGKWEVRIKDGQNWSRTPL